MLLAGRSTSGFRRAGRRRTASGGRRPAAESIGSTRGSTPPTSNTSVALRSRVSLTASSQCHRGGRPTTEKGAQRPAQPVRCRVSQSAITVRLRGRRARGKSSAPANPTTRCAFGTASTAAVRGFVHRVRTAFSLQVASMAAKVTQEVTSLHPTTTFSRTASRGSDRRPSRRRSSRIRAIASDKL